MSCCLQYPFSTAPGEMLGLDIPLSALGKGRSVPWVSLAGAGSTRARGITLCQAFPDPLASREQSRLSPALGQRCSVQDLGSQHPLVGEGWGRGGRGIDTGEGGAGFPCPVKRTNYSCIVHPSLQ